MRKPAISKNQTAKTFDKIKRLTDKDKDKIQKTSAPASPTDDKRTGSQIVSGLAKRQSMADAAKRQGINTRITTNQVDAYGKANAGDMPVYRRRIDTPAGTGYDVTQYRYAVTTDLIRKQQEGRRNGNLYGDLNAGYIGERDARNWANEYRQMGQLEAADWFDNAADILAGENADAKKYAINTEVRSDDAEKVRQMFSGDYDAYFEGTYVSPEQYAELLRTGNTYLGGVDTTDYASAYNDIIGVAKGSRSMADNAEYYAQQQEIIGDPEAAAYFRENQQAMSDNADALDEYARSLYSDETREKLANELYGTAWQEKQLANEATRGTDTHLITDAERGAAASNINDQIAQYDTDIAALEQERMALEARRQELDPDGTRLIDARYWESVSGVDNTSADIVELKQIESELAAIDQQISDKNTLRSAYDTAGAYVEENGDARVYDDDAMRDISEFEDMFRLDVGPRAEYMQTYRNLNWAAGKAQDEDEAEEPLHVINSVHRAMDEAGVSYSDDVLTAAYMDGYMADVISERTSPGLIQSPMAYYTPAEYTTLMFARENMPGVADYIEEYYNREANRRKSEDVERSTLERFEGKPVAAVPFAVAGGVTSVVDGIDTKFQSIMKDLGMRDFVDPYRVDFSTIGDAATEAGIKAVDEQFGTTTINEMIGTEIPLVGDMKVSDLYATGVEAIRNYTNNLAFGPYVGAATFFQVYGDTYTDAYERGGTHDQANKLGMLAGLAEGVGEKLSYDTFAKMFAGDGITFKRPKNVMLFGLLSVLENGEEFVQESATTAMNEAFDRYVMGENSQYNIDRANYIAAGYSPEEAEQLAQSNCNERILRDGVIGGLTGLMRVGGNSIASGARNLYNTYSNDVSIGRDIRKSGNAENLTQQMSIITGKDIKTPRTNRGTGKLFNEYVKAVGKDPALAMTASKMTGTSAATKKTAETRKSEFGVSEDGKTTVGGKDVKIQGINDTKKASSDIRVNVTYADNTTGEVKLSDINFGDDKAAEVYSYAADMPTPSIANVFRTAMKTQPLDNIDSVANGFAQAYDMGRAGYRNIETVANSPLTKALTAEQVKMAYEQGVADRAEAQQKNVKEVSERVKAAMGNEWKGGTVTFDRVDAESLNDTQKRQVELATAISGMLGINVRFYESGVRNNTYQGANGSYNRKTNTISLDINAGRNRVSDSIAQTALLRTMSHEITHAIQRNSPEQYEAIREAVLDVIGKTKGVTLDTLVNEKMVKDKSLKSREAAVDEVVADACETMLRDSDAVKQLMEAHPEAAKTFKDTVLRILDKLLEAIRAAFNGNRVSRESKLIESDIERISELWSKAVVEVAEVSGREYSTGSEDSIGDTEAFNDSIEAVQNQARPPYTDGTKACTEFVESLNKEARATYDLLYNFYQASRLGKKNLSSKFMYYTDWNAMVAKDPRWAERAQAMADVLPESIRKKMNMNPDGTLSPNTLEAEFKMNRSMGQRIIDALETEVIDPYYTIEGTTYKISTGNTANAVGGEAYRRAICEEVRRAYRAGTLKQARISTLSKDRWGSLGFLATNGKTGASGDFTTLCPQMFYNKGCHYCYRLAALKTGVNNKLVGANVWYGGEILRIKDSDIDMLNENGGLRIQSFGDWMPQFSSQLADMLYDAEMRGLQIKIITKEPSMIEYVAQLREQGLGKNLYFNLSADYAIERAGNRETADYVKMNIERPIMKDANGDFWWKRAMTVQEANKYRQKYPWVNTRIVATTQEEFIRGLKDPTVDVVTGYHGNIREWERIDSETGDVMLNVEALGDAGMPVFAYDAITGEWTLEREGKTATHKALAKRIAAEGLQYEYYIKSCCIDGRCAKCKGKCGKLAKDFNIKNATNRDSESVAYWQEQMEYDETDDVQYQTRDYDEPSDREILMNALKSAAKDSTEVSYLLNYKKQLAELDAKQIQLDRHNAVIKRLLYKKGRTEEENKQLYEARTSAQILRGQLSVADNALLKLEAAAPLRNIVAQGKLAVRMHEAAAMAKFKREWLEQYEKRYEALAERHRLMKDTQNRATRRASIIRRVKRLDQLVRNATDQKHIPDGLGGAIIDLMQNFTQDTSVFDKKRLVNIQNEYALLKESKLDSGSLYDKDTHMLLAELGNLIGGRRLSALSFDELSFVRDIIGHFEKLVKDANRVFVEGRRQSIDDISAKFVEEVSGKNYKASQLKASNLYKWLTKGQITPIYFFEQLGGEMGRLGKAIIEGQSRWGRLMEKADLRVKQIQQEYHYLDWVDAKDNTKVFETEAGAQIKLNREQALGIYATAKRERSNTLRQASHLASGGVIFKLATKDLPLIKGIHVSQDGTPLTKKDVSAIENWLTEEQKSYADAIVAYMSRDMAELGNETSMKLHGYRKFGEGYYYPYKTSSAHRKTNLNEVENALLKNMSFSKRTVKGATAPIEIGEFTLTCTEHIEGMIRYHSMAVEQDSFMRVFDHHLNPNQTIRSMLTSAYGENTTDYILQFMKDIYGGVTRDSNEAIGSKWLARYKKSAVMFSLSTAIQQPSSLPRAFAEVNLKYFVGKPHTGSFKEAKQYAGTAVIKEIGSFDTFNGRNAAEWLAGKRPKGIIDKTIQKIDDAGGYLPEKLDQLTWGRIWEAVKREQAEKTGLDINSEELKVIAGKRFDEVVTKTQVFDSVMAKSQNMRDNSLWMKMVTSFMGEPTVTYNMLYNAIANAKTNPGKASAVLGSVLLSIIMNAALKSIVTGARDDDDEKSRYSERYIKNFFADLVNGLNPLEYIPFIKDAWSIFKDFKVERTDMEIFNLAYDFWKLLQDEDRTWKQTLNTTTSFVSMLTGLPFKNIWKDINGVGNTFRAIFGDKKDKDSERVPREWREGWFGSSVKRGLSEGAILSLWFDDSKSANVDAMYEHLLDGDIEAANDSRKYLIDYNGVKDDKAVNTLLRTRIKEGFEDGDISREKAAEMLHEHTGLTKTEADRRVSEWAYKVDTDVAYGDIKEKFIDGDMTAEEAIEARVEYGGADEEDAEATIRKWEYEKETGFAYDDMKDAYLNGEITKKQVIDARVKYGGVSRADAESTVAKWDFEVKYGAAYSEMGDAYIRGDLTEKQAVASLMEYGGMREPEALQIVAEWDYEKATGRKWSEMKDDYINGDMTAAQVLKARTTYSDEFESDINAQIKKWDYERDTGRPYNDMKAAYIDGEISNKQAIADRVKYGGMDQEDAELDVSKWDFEVDYGYDYNDMDEHFKLGNIRKDEAIAARVKYGKQKEDDAYFAVTGWEYEQQTGKEWKGKTTKVRDAIDKGDVNAMTVAMTEVYEHSDYKDEDAAASAMTTAITNYYKPLYIAATPAERTAMEGKLLDAYELAYTLVGKKYYGDNRRLKAIRKWLEED